MFNNSCVGVSTSEVRIINSKRSISWDCAACEKMGNDMKSLKSALVLLQSEIKELKAQISLKPTQPSFSNDSFEDIVHELEERQARKKNIIVVGLPEQSSTVSRERRVQSDLERVSTILAHVSADSAVVASVHRLGKFNPNNSKPRLLKVELSDEKHVKDLLMKSKCLKNSDEYKHIVLFSDKTPRQLEYYRDLKAKLVERISSGETDIGIKYIKGIPKIVSLN